MIRTKIVATLGPASSDPAVLKNMLETGVDVCRINFSHGTLTAAAALLASARDAAARCGKAVAILGDVSGPKIRLGPIADSGGCGGMPISPGQSLIIQRQPIEGRDLRISTTHSGLVDDITVGDSVLVEDGLLRFLCTAKNADELVCVCTAGGVLKTAKGINLPNTAINLPSVTERDWEAIDWSIENRLDYLGLSFVRRPEDITSVREYLKNKDSDLHLIAKIEKGEALSQIDAVIDAADALMVARGDLGVELDVAQVPLIQKDLVRRCRLVGKPVIVATQMLQSMIEQSSPTRAEVSDVANSIFDGTDAIMLSGETSIGKFPLESVRMMAHIAQVTEDYLADSSASDDFAPRVKTTLPSGALARGAVRVVRDLHAKLVVVWSQSGETGRVFSKHRFSVPIIALSGDPRTLRHMALYYGVVPQEAKPSADMEQLIANTDRILLERKFAAKGDHVVIVAGWSAAMPDTMNGMVIHAVGESWTTVPTSQALQQLARAEKD